MLSFHCRRAHSFPGRLAGAVAAAVVFAALSSTPPAQAQSANDEATQAPAERPAPASDIDCSGLPNHRALAAALKKIVTPGDTETNGGLGNNMWAAVVDRSGAVCAVAHSGDSFDAQWPGSRAIAASKAFTANAFSLTGFALSTANLFWPSMPRNSLYGLETSNPIRPEAVYRGPATSWGTEADPIVGQRIGGITLFAGGLALYTPKGDLIGGLGLSGDQSCTDHVIAWKVRHTLNLDNVPKGVSPDGDDNIIYDLSVDPGSGQTKSASGYGHPTCSPGATEIAKNFPSTFPTGPEE